MFTFKNLVGDYLESDKGGACVFLDSPRHADVNALLLQDLRAAFDPVYVFNFEEFLGFEPGAGLPKPLAAAIEGSRWVIQNTKFYPEYVPFINTLHNHLLKLKDKKLVAIQGLAAEELLESTLSGKRELMGLGEKLIRLFTATSGHPIRVSNPAGTDLTLRLSPRFGWIRHDMSAESPIIPNGEIETYCPDVDGAVVVDGSIFSTLEMLADEPPLAGRPVELTIQHARVVEVRCRDDRRLEEKLRLRMEWENRLGEVGFAFNYGVTRFRGHNNPLDERLPNFHIGVGQGDYRVGEPPFESDYHTDFMLAGATIAVAGETVMKQGRLRL